MNKNNQSDQLDKLLGSLFYRRSCPETEMLGEYHMNLLPPGQRLVVAQHMRACPHCSAELARYTVPEKEEQSWLGQLGELITQVRWATETATPQLALRDRSALDGQKIYKEDGIKVEIDIIPARYQRWELVGEATTENTIGRVTLWDGLDDQRTEIESRPIDQDDGYFRFQQLKSGIYYLCFSSPPVEIWLGQIEIGEIDTS